MISHTFFDPAFVANLTTSGAPVLWTPAQIASTTLWVWQDYSDLASLTLVSGAISQVNDKSGNGNHYIQSTAANRPLSQSNIQNSKSAAYFGNTGSVRHFLERLSISYSGNQMTFFSVFRNSALPGGAPYPANSFGRMFSFAGSSGDDFNSTAGIALGHNGASPASQIAPYLYRNSATIAQTSPNNDIWCVIDAQRNGTAGRISLNGGTYVTGTTSSANQAITRGRVGNNFAAADCGILGWIGEQLILIGPVTDALCQQVRGYLAWGWGLQGLLPAGDPYKSAPPYVS
jgi:hypothetical protein